MLSVDLASPGPSTRHSSRGVVLLFGAGLWCAALLMFLLEPMAAKMVLPFLGGAPGVWNTCVVFFQVMLLAGYTYAHAGQRLLGVQRLAALHAVLLLASILALPAALQLTASPGEGSQPALWLLLLLLKSIGLPFFLLTTTAPLLQTWFSQTSHRASRDPYFLYAASNFGSLIGLLMYPFLVEPHLPLRLQAAVWKYGYAGFVLLMVSCALMLRRHSARLTASAATRDAPPDPVTRTSRPSAGRRLRWLMLSFAPSSLMLAVTTFISTDIASVPLFWVLPLALYLFTFVLAFSVSPRYPRGVVDRALPLLLLPLVLFLVLRVNGPFALVTPTHLAVFFLAALVCHRSLADDRPDAAHLTEFYLLVALGGVLGSLFNTLAAPLLFTGIVEYPAVLVLVCLLRGIPPGSISPPGLWRVAGPAVVGIASIAVVVATSGTESATLRFGLLGIPAFLCLTLSRTRLPFAAAILALLASSAFERDELGRVLHAERTFFGAYKVRIDSAGEYYALTHGTTLHGVQSALPSRRHEPQSYYHRTGPLGDVFRLIGISASSPRIAVVGLGVGSVATYRRPSQVWTFFEIDPAVERIARSEHFSYLNECGTACQVSIGDARLSLAAQDAQFGVIVLDAFSSDAIPTHLLTREAIQIYLSRLAPGGVLAFHISNRHLDLEPVLGRLAQEAKLVSLIRRDQVAAGEQSGKSSSDWVVMARTSDDLVSVNQDSNWRPTRSEPGTALWTDDFSNVLTLLLQR